MTLVPRQPALRVLAALWLLTCLAVLLLTLLKHELYANQRSALTQLVTVYFLGFPSIHIAVLASAKIKLDWYLHARFEPSILSESVFLWTLMVALGYAQWFVVLPWISRKCWGLCNALFCRSGSSMREKPGDK